MNSTDQLIDELCLEGVTFVEIGDIAEIKAGQSISKIFIQQNQGDYPVVNSGKEPLGFINTYNTENNEIGITSRGAGVGFVSWTEGKYYRGNLNYGLEIHDHKALSNRFLYHVLLASKNDIDSLCVFSGIPALNASQLKRLKIPLPPLLIQERIVRILDNFTLLTAELTAEMTARQLQYEYYLDELLTFGKEVEFKSLGQIGQLIRGSGLQKSDFKEEGFPCIHYGQIHTHYKTSADKTISFVSEDLSKKLKKANKGDVLIVGVSENVQDICKPLAWLGEEVAISGDMFAFRHDQNTKYITYSLMTKAFGRYKEQFAHGAKVTRLRQEKLLSYKIPLPPIAEQARIVSILDKFDALVNDLSSGIPAEIEARQKQYEYYRDRLLTFKEKVS